MHFERLVFFTQIQVSLWRRHFQIEVFQKNLQSTELTVYLIVRSWRDVEFSLLGLYRGIFPFLYLCHGNIDLTEDFVMSDSISIPVSGETLVSIWHGKGLFKGILKCRYILPKIGKSSLRGMCLKRKGKGVSLRTPCRTPAFLYIMILWYFFSLLIDWGFPSLTPSFSPGLMVKIPCPRTTTLHA